MYSHARITQPVATEYVLIYNTEALRESRLLHSFDIHCPWSDGWDRPCPSRAQICCRSYEYVQINRRWCAHMQLMPNLSLHSQFLLYKPIYSSVNMRRWECSFSSADATIDGEHTEKTLPGRIVCILHSYTL